MLLINLGGYVCNALVDAIERFCPVLVEVTLGPTSRCLAVGVKDGGQVKLHVCQVASRNRIIDASSSQVTEGAGKTHDGLGPPHSAGCFRLSLHVLRGPLGVFAVLVGSQANGGHRYP